MPYESAARAEVEATFARFFPYDALSARAEEIIDTFLAESPA